MCGPMSGRQAPADLARELRALASRQDGGRADPPSHRRNSTANKRGRGGPQGPPFLVFLGLGSTGRPPPSAVTSSGVAIVDTSVWLTIRAVIGTVRSARVSRGLNGSKRRQNCSVWHRPNRRPTRWCPSLHPAAVRAVVRQSADCAGRPAKVARYATPGCSVPSMRWSHPSSECARSAAAPERDGRGSSIALTNTASNNAPKPTSSENIGLLQFSPQGPDAGRWRSCGQSEVKRFTPHTEAAPHRRPAEILPDVGKYSGWWSRLCRHKRAPPIAMIAGQSRPSQGAYQGAPMRSMPRCGTVQDPPRAAVPPARGGIGPGSKRPAWADPELAERKRVWVLIAWRAR